MTRGSWKPQEALEIAISKAEGLKLEGLKVINWKQKSLAFESLFILAAIRNTAHLYPTWRLLKFGCLGYGVSRLCFSMKARLCLQTSDKNLSTAILTQKYLRTETWRPIILFSRWDCKETEPHMKSFRKCLNPSHSRTLSPFQEPACAPMHGRRAQEADVELQGAKVQFGCLYTLTRICHVPGMFGEISHRETVSKNKI